MKKVLIIYNQLFHYRRPIFKILAEKCDLTVAFSLGSGEKLDANYKIIKLPILKMGRFVLHRVNIYKLCCQFDVVIAYGDIAWLKLSSLPFRRKRDFKVIFWSPGVSASYDKKYDEVSRWDNVRDFFYRRADALVFYSDYPIQKYTKRGFRREKLFVANNTVEVNKSQEESAHCKDSILFIGSIYMQKGVLKLLENYESAHNEKSDIPILNIIGWGDEFKVVERWVKAHKLESKIFLKGAIYDAAEKAKYFKKAIACISPSQAGLSVLESMGYGVPFITMHDANTGGERHNIKHGYNGLLLKEISELKSIIIDITVNQYNYIAMGNNALEYYNKNTRPEDMVNGLTMAIDYVSR